LYWDAGKLKETGTSASVIGVIVSLIWIVWAFNCFVNTIIVLNLLIAEVNNTFQTIMTEGQELDYLVMAENNFLYSKYMRFWNWSRLFCFSICKKKMPPAQNVFIFACPL